MYRVYIGRSVTDLDKLKENNMTIRIEDLNAKIADDSRGYEGVMGRHGLGEMDENGEMFSDLKICASNRLVIEGSVSSHRRIHKTT